MEYSDWRSELSENKECDCEGCGQDPCIKCGHSHHEVNEGVGTALALGAVTPGLGKAAYGGAKSAARGAGIASGNVYRGAKSAAFNVEQSTRGFKKMKRRPSRKSSSLAIWADGFSSPTTGELL